MAGLNTRTFGTLPDGTPVEAFLLENGVFSAEVLSFGATLRSFKGPDRAGVAQSVVLGYTRLEDYLLGRERQGATMGRFVNRIGGASFTLEGQTYRLVANDGPNCIHGGNEGFDRRVWSVTAMDFLHDPPFVTFQMLSPDGDQGFPGDVTLTVTYTLYADGSLSMRYAAQVSCPTVLNLTNHAYFNLAGEGAGQVTDHVLTIAADHMLPIDDAILPTGEIRPVDRTVFDFRQGRRLGDGLRVADRQIMLGRGYDHCFRLAEGRRAVPEFAARVSDPHSGRVLEVLTTEPGLQLNSGNVLTGRFAGDAGRTYRQSDGFCLEAQQFPDAPNKPQFPSCVVLPETGLQAETIYRLGCT